MAAPGHMLVRPRQHQSPVIENGGVWPFDIEDFSGTPSCEPRSSSATSTSRVEPQKRELLAHCIVKRAAVSRHRCGVRQPGTLDGV